MAERTLWTYLKKGMKPHWRHAARHEDYIGIGVPDLSFFIGGKNGWMELKEVRKVPKRVTTGVRMNFTPHQHHFLTIREGWLFVRINDPDWGTRAYMLFNHKNLPACEKPYPTIDEMARMAVRVYFNRVNWEDFACRLKN